MKWKKIWLDCRYFRSSHTVKRTILILWLSCWKLSLLAVKITNPRCKLSVYSHSFLVAEWNCSSRMVLVFSGQTCQFCIVHELWGEFILLCNMALSAWDPWPGGCGKVNVSNTFSDRQKTIWVKTDHRQLFSSHIGIICIWKKSNWIIRGSFEKIEYEASGWASGWTSLPAWGWAGWCTGPTRFGHQIPNVLFVNSCKSSSTVCHLYVTNLFDLVAVFFNFFF